MVLKTGLRISEVFFLCIRFMFFRSSHFPSKVENNYFEGCSRQKQDQSKKLLLSPPAGPPKIWSCGPAAQFSALFPFSVSVFGTVLNSIREQENARLEYFGTVLKSSDSQLLDQQLIWNGPYSKTDEVMLEGS